MFIQILKMKGYIHRQTYKHYGIWALNQIQHRKVLDKQEFRHYNINNTNGEIGMKDILQDIVSHTHSLGFLNLVKVSADNDNTTIDSMAEDRSVILSSQTHNKVSEFDGTFGMPNLDKLALHLKNPEYQKDAKLEVVKADRNGEEIPTHIHFENATGDFQNDYRFMNKQIIEEKLKTVKFKGAQWNVSFKPTIAAINRMKLQSAAHSEEPTFNVKTEDTGGATDLIFSFGDSYTCWKFCIPECSRR